VNEPIGPSEEALRKHFERVFAKAYAPRKIYDLVVRFFDREEKRIEDIREDLWW
jgi:hypothetical protein